MRKISTSLRLLCFVRFILFGFWNMRFSKKSVVDFGLEAEGKQWVIAGISVRSSLKPINTKIVGKEWEHCEEDRLYTTPTAKEARLPAKFASPMAPRKHRHSKRHIKGVEAEAKNWVIAGISVRSLLKAMNTKIVRKEREDGKEHGLYSTPTAKEARLPAKLASPAAPRKRRHSKCDISGAEAEAKKRVIAGISVRSSWKPIKTQLVGKEREDGEEDRLYTTPTAKETRIPATLASPTTPRKCRPSKCRSNGVKENFIPPDLETDFIKKAV